MLDHIEPRHRRGGDSWANLTASCASCNQRKGARSLLGYLGGRLHRAVFGEVIDWLDGQREGWYPL